MGGEGDDEFSFDPIEFELPVAQPCEKSVMRKRILAPANTFISFGCSKDPFLWAPDL